jgi:TonB family protein
MWLVALASARASFGQSLTPQPFPPPDVVAAHLLDRVDVRYPAIAEAARVVGTIQLVIEVDKTGRVARVRHLTFVPMLDQAAEDGVLKARFSPFERDGHPTRVRLRVILHFEIGGSAKVGTEFDTAIPPALQSMANCEDAIEARSSAVELCRSAVEASDAYDKMALDLQLESRRNLGRALQAAGQTQSAMQVIDGALRMLPPADWRQPVEREVLLAEAARLRLAANDQPKALDLFNQAASGLERRLSQPHVTPLERLTVVAELRRLLPEYAEVLDAAGKPKDADAARQRASRLK